jgi:hypothetical protein
MHAGLRRVRGPATGLAILLWLALSAVPAAAAEGVLLSVSDRVEVEVHGAGRPAKTGLRLRPGDVVRSIDGGASGILEDGRLFRVGRGEAYTVPGDRAAGPAGELASRLMDTLRETASRGRGPITGVPEREEGGIRLLYPHNARLLPGDLRFEWEPGEGVDRVEITVKSVFPAYKETFASAAGETGAFLPPDAPPLVPGVRYYWKVEGIEKGTGEPRASELAWFSLLEPGRIREMRSSMEAVEAMDFLEEQGRDVLRASLLVSYGLHHRAETVLKGCLERHPGAPGVTELLGGLYLEMKRIEDAERIL